VALHSATPVAKAHAVPRTNRRDRDCVRCPCMVTQLATAAVHEATRPP
jgi:hypothetical protein